MLDMSTLTFRKVHINDANNLAVFIRLQRYVSGENYLVQYIIVEIGWQEKIVYMDNWIFPKEKLP